MSIAMEACPKLRCDLQVSEQRARGATVYVLKEPSSGRIFRFPEAAYFIAQQLDGRSTPQDIHRRVEAKFGDAVAPDALESFLAELRKLRLLEDGTAAPGPSPPPAGRLRGDVFYLRWKAVDPDAFLDRLLPKVRRCFTSGFLWVSAAVVVLACGVAATDWPALHQALGRLQQFHAIAYAWFVLLLTASLHELAHGLTCKYFGGQVREMGVMFIYFQPALYCNVTDAWLFPEKAKRLWVTFAGAYLDILLWALAVLVWRITEADTWVHFTALVIVATSGIRTLFNLNPLIKLDGYYLLSDLLDAPNLRSRAFGFLRRLWRRVWDGADATIAETSARERRIYVAYGLLAAVYSVALFGSITWWVGSTLVDRLRGLGFLLFTVLLTMLLRHPIKRVLAGLPEGLRHGPVWFRSKKRPVKALVVLALVAVLFLIPATINVSGEVTILPIENSDIRAEVEGLISEIYVAEGDAVEAGTPIARISDDKYTTELRTVEAAIQEKQATFRSLARSNASDAHATRDAVLHAESEQSRAARLAAAQASVDRARADLKQGKQSLARMRTLVAEGFFALTKLEEAETDVSLRRNALEEAQAALRVVQTDNVVKSREDVAIAEALAAEIASLEARHDYLRSRIDRALIRSPHAGVVTTPRFEQQIGQYVDEGDLIAEVHEVKQVTAEIAVLEREIADVRVGQPVTLKVRAYPGETFHGRVTKIAPATRESDKPSGARIVRVTTVIDNAGQLLKSGMTGYAKIRGDKRPLIEALGRSIAGTLRVEVWSWW